MIFRKHLKLFRKFLGSLVRPRHGAKGNLVGYVKSFYLLFSWCIEICGDFVTIGRRRKVDEIRRLRRILIVKDDQLGDVLFATLLIQPIRERHPEARIDFLVRPAAVQVLEKNPLVENIYRWNNALLEFLPGRGERKAMWSKMLQNRITRRVLTGNRYDVVINARAYPPSGNLRWRGVGRILIAFDLSERSFLADHWAEYSLEEEEWKNYANLLEPLGINSSSMPFAPGFHNCASNPMAGTGDYTVLSPVSFERDRQWDDAQWKDLMGLISETGMSVALTGVPPQRAYLEKLAANSGSAVRVFTTLRLPEFGALMRDSAFFIGIDSFPAHLALALKKRAALLINPGVYFLPGYSRARFASEARSMLPIVPNISFFDVRSAQAQDVASTLGVHCKSR